MIALLLAAASPIGMAGAECTPGARGARLEVQVAGWKDRRGRIRVELYPPDDGDFLADDTDLIAAGKPFRRIDLPVPPSGPVTLCIMAPAPGRYALVVLHDRDGNHKFGVASDGIGFGGNPRLGWSKPKAAAAAVTVPSGGGSVHIVLNYRRGLAMRPLDTEDRQ
jgi:uncharacterized protein (DUF2141 family)